ncbi:hypothetical protein [Desulfosporosinus sp. FKB]|uniref:hypothetical protein n=1 Tax=Desulfosporosinus sp. FKB TaxID=1969835 RepID=UPI000B4985A9|nr:hypothetical protein [Desulfosporosinus sp. FKB]
MPPVINLICLIIFCAIAFFLGQKIGRLIPKGKEFIGLVCSIGILIVFFMTKDNLLSTDKNSLVNAIAFGVVYGLAFGIGNRGHKLNKK